MSRRLLLIVAFASVVGLLAAVAVYQVVLQKISLEAGKQATDQIVVATVKMDLGEPVTSRHVKLTPWPKHFVPQGAVRSLAEAEGQVVRSSIVVGEPLLKHKLFNVQAGAGTGILPMLVPEGLRGVTIKVDKAIEESGFLQPNSHVDVLVSLTRGGGEQVAKVILQNVPVLAAGQTVEMHEKKPMKITTVTLALTPEQAERLALAQASGKLMLAMRNFRDKEAVETLGVTRSTLLGHAPSVPQPKPTEARVAQSNVKTHRVSVHRGGTVTEYDFTRLSGKLWVAVNPPGTLR